MSQDLTPATLRSVPAPLHFSRERQVAFLQALAKCGNVLASAQAAGVSRSTVYRMRRACVHFEDLWNAALLLARPIVEDALADRALNGVEESVFYHGEEVATRTRYDSRLLLAHLGRLDQLNANKKTREDSWFFDARLQELLEEDEMPLIEVGVAVAVGEGDEAVEHLP